MPPQPAAPNAPRRRRWLRLAVAAAGVLVALALLLAGAIAWLWRDEATMARALQHVPGLRIEGARGRLTGGPYAVQRIEWQQRPGGLRVVVEGLAWDDADWRWRPRSGAWFALGLTGARATRVRVETGPPSPPSPPPASLELPFELRAPALRVGSVEVDGQAPITAVAGDVHLGAAAGGSSEHRVERVALQRDGVALTEGSLVIGAAKPLPLQARATLSAPPRAAQPWQAQLRLLGPLERLSGDVELAYAGGGATLQATLAPFAPWPLLALSAQARDLDLAALAPGLPQTRLSGRALLADSTAGSGDGDVASVTLEVDNALPGSWDRGRVPVERLALRLQGRPADPSTLEFQAFDARLAAARPRVRPPAKGQRGAAPAPASVVDPAGHVTGSGRWQGRRVEVELELADLAPDRLDSRAPAMTVAGRVALAFDGSAVPAAAAAPAASAPVQVRKPASAASGAAGGWNARVRADLTGRLPRRDVPPLVLHADATAARAPDGSLQLTLAQLEAHGGASSSALATAQGGRDAAGAWRVATRGELRGFDPAPWWPASTAPAAKPAASSPAPARVRSAARAGAPATAASAPRRAPTAAAAPPARAPAQTDAVNARWQADLRWPAPPAARSAPSATASAVAAAAPKATAAGPRLDQVVGSAELTLADSRIGGVAWQGQAGLQAAAGQPLQASADLRAGANRLRAAVTLPRSALAAAGGGDPLQGRLDVDAPELAALAPLSRWLPADVAAWWPRAGSVAAQAQVDGAWPALHGAGQLQVRGLRSGGLALGQADARWDLSLAHAGVSADAPLSLQLDAADVAWGERRIERVEARVQGQLKSHQFELRATSPLRPPEWAQTAAATALPGGSQFVLQGRGAWSPAGADAAGAAGGSWKGTIAELRAAPRDAPASPWLAASNLQGQLLLGADGAPVGVTLAPGRIAAFGGGIAWTQAVWRSPAAASGGAPQIALQARVDPVQVAPWLVRLQPQFGWQGALALGGTVNVQGNGDRFDADVVVERTGGDLSLTIEGATRALELGNVRFALAAHGGQWDFTQAVVGRSVGVVGGLQSVRTTPQAMWPEESAPLSGGVSLLVPELQVWAPWLPPGWRLGGQLRVAASFAGRFGAPEYRGEVTGEDLAVRNLFEGIHLRQGALAVVLSGTDATVQRFEFRDGSSGDSPGLLRVTGSAAFGDAPRARLRASAEKLRALDRVDRRVMLSGAADVDWQPAKLGVKGDFRIDEGLIDATQSDAPSNDGDVRVVNRAPLRATGPVAAAAPAARPTGPAKSPLGQADVDLRVDLGPALHLRGRGIDTTLRGLLRVTTLGGQLAVNGTVDAAGGTYTAYGQNLRIERGSLMFSGNVATPQLDFLALRADIDTRVGVVVTGSVANPRVRLYSESELGQLDTLTWLLLGRAPEGLGRDDTALLQRAALALLSGDRNGDQGLLKRIGLDELSLRRSGSSDTVAGETIVSLGKQVSKRVYVGYEQALGAAGGTLQLIYRVANKITLRARAGSENAVDAIWTWRWN